MQKPLVGTRQLCRGELIPDRKLHHKCLGKKKHAR